MRRCMVVLTMVLAACGGDSATEPPPPPPPLGPVSLSIVAGDAQSDTVLSLLADPVTVLAYRDAGSSVVRLAWGVSAQTTTQRVPVAGQVVNFVVIDSACGRPFAGSAVTDSTGRVLERWELGTKAGECRMEARAVDQTTGEAIVYDTATATVLPGAVDTLQSVEYGLLFAGESFAPGALVRRAVDQYGNIVASPPVTVAAVENAGGWTISDGSITAPAAVGEARFSLQSGGLSSPVRLTVAPDLSQHVWDADGECSFEFRADYPYDSVAYAVSVDSVRYVALSGAVKDRRPTLYTSGAYTWYRRDGTADTTSRQDVVYTDRQVADSLILNLNSDFRFDNVSLRTDTDPMTYEGGPGLCGTLIMYGAPRVVMYRPWKMVAQ